MKSWQPAQIVMLTLPKQGLLYFNVSALVNLEYLDLSRNAIKDLRGMGLEKCGSLQHLNLRQNLVSKRESLKVLGFLKSMQYFLLKGNPVTKLADYRTTGLYISIFQDDAYYLKFCISPHFSHSLIL